MHFKIISRRRRKASTHNIVTDEFLLSNRFYCLNAVCETENDFTLTNRLSFCENANDVYHCNNPIVVNDTNVVIPVDESTCLVTESDNWQNCNAPDGIDIIDSNDDDTPETVYPEIKSYRAKFAKNIIVAHLNINGLRNKFDEIKYIMRCGFLDILALSETKLDSADNSNCYQLEGFSMIRKDKHKNSGGLLMYISNRIPHREITLEKQVPTNYIEVMPVELIIDKSDKWFLGLIYKNPLTHKLDFESFLSDLSNQCLNAYDNNMLIGDMNFNMLSKPCLLKELCDIYGYENLIESPTCLKANNPTLIDVLLVTDKRRFFKGFSYDIGVSDFHCLIGAALRKHIPCAKSKIVQYRNLKDINYNNVRLDLFDICLVENINNTPDANAAFSNFHNALMSTLNNHAPLKTKTVKPADFPLMNPELHNAIFLRNKFRNKFYKYRTAAYYALYKEKRNAVTAIKRSLIRSYFLKRCNGGSRNKDFWKTIRPFFSKKSNSSSDITLREGNDIITDEEKLCNIFNDFFVSIGSEIGEVENNDRPLADVLETYKNHSSITMINTLGLELCSFKLTPINIVDTKKAIAKLNPRKASGFDGIPPAFIKTLKNDLAESITLLINKCISQNVFPDSLKKSNISPVFKKKNPLNKDNYRSINLLPILSKLFERLVNDQIYGYMNQIFHRLMSGFRKKHGCKDIMTKMTEDWRKALDYKNTIGVIAIDLSKAFDCMPHGLLLAKMYQYGIDLPTCELIKSYLCNRQQRVKLGSKKSPWVSSIKGVPQGSILGPLLFNIFINDLLLLDMESIVYNYADDNTIVCIDKDISVVKTKIQLDAKKAIVWFKENHMKANPEKFQVMFIGKDANIQDDFISLGEAKIYASNSITILGLELDTNLNFNKCVETICSKVSKQINALVRIRNDLDHDSRKAIYNSYVASNINYCCTVWMFTGRTNLSKLNKLNERALRMVYNDYSSDYDSLLLLNNTLNSYKTFLSALATEMFKIKQGMCPAYLKDLFVPNNSLYMLRDTDTYVLPKFNTKTYGYHCMSYIGSKLWNNIDANIKSLNINGFKKNIKIWLANQNNVIDTYF